MQVAIYGTIDGEEILFGYIQPGETRLHAIARLVLRLERIVNNIVRRRGTVRAYEMTSNLSLKIDGTTVIHGTAQELAAQRELADMHPTSLFPEQEETSNDALGSNNGKTEAAEPDWVASTAPSNLERKKRSRRLAESHRSDDTSRKKGSEVDSPGCSSREASSSVKSGKSKNSRVPRDQVS